MIPLFSLVSRLSGRKTIIICLILLNILSLSALYSSLHLAGQFKNVELFYKQITWIAISWVILIIFTYVNYRFFYDFSWVMYGLSVVLLLAVDLAGRTALGAQRWISLGGFNFQPSEFAKIATIFLIARFFSNQDPKGFIKDLGIPLGLIGVLCLLIFKQPDLGSSLVPLFIVFAIGLASRLPKRYFISLIIAGLIIAPLGWHSLKEYQKKRLVVFINPNVDPLGAGYTIIQSKIAIGSGKFFGKGFLSGTQNQFNFLPERHTDFIFTVVAEEFGFVGGLFLLILYWLILSKILDLIKQTNDEFARLIGIGLSSLFFFHIVINMGMTMGVFPVVGIPLIFLSYGGSSLMLNFLMVGVLFNISRQSQYNF